MTSQVKAWEQSPVARMGLLGAVTLREQDEHQLGGHRIPASLPACFLPLWRGRVPPPAAPQEGAHVELRPCPEHRRARPRRATAWGPPPPRWGHLRAPKKSTLNSQVKQLLQQAVKHPRPSVPARGTQVPCPHRATPARSPRCCRLGLLRFGVQGGRGTATRSLPESKTLLSACHRPYAHGQLNPLGKSHPQNSWPGPFLPELSRHQRAAIGGSDRLTMRLLFLPPTWDQAELQERGSRGAAALGAGTYLSLHRAPRPRVLRS
nr:uncharacterized protein LOC125183178 isoform X1 [Anser cygnoides]